MDQTQLEKLVVLDASASDPFEIFAQLQALMCFPDATSEGRDRVARAICADILDQQCELQPELAATLRAQFPEYLKSRNRVSLASHGRRWDEAFSAGKYFLARVKFTATGEHPIVDGMAREMSRRQLVAAMFPAREDGLEINYESRLHDIEKHSITRFYPVAHLAAAYQCAAHTVSPENEAADFDVHDLHFHKIIVQLAGVYARCIRDTPQLESVASRMIDVEWRD